MPIVRGNKPGVWKAYYWDRTDRKQKWVPADVVRQWDGMDEQAAENAFNSWIADNGLARVRARRKSLFASDELNHLIDDFIDEEAALSPDTSESTRQTVKSHLHTYIKEYFVQVHGQKDVRTWWQHASGFTRWLRDTYPNLSLGTVKKVGQSLRRFGEYLLEENVIRHPWRLKRIRNSASSDPETPLPREILPAEILEVADKLPPEMALAVLLGYFTSLRPQEVYGVEKSDFITGDRAKKDAKTYQRFTKVGLGSGLSVAVSRSRSRKGRTKLKTKASYGVVNCWNLDGAKAIAAILKNLQDGPIFGDTPRDALDKTYKKMVFPLLDVVLYDLRRASGLYLGRTMGCDIFLLQDHFRHRSITTTMRYTRRPKDEKETADNQDFDDVG
jgi:integrase